MPAVTEQFVSEFLVSGFASFRGAMETADNLMGRLEKSGASAGNIITNALGTALGNTLANAAGTAVGALRGAGRAFTGFVRDGFDMAVDFESSMVELQLAADATGLSFDELKEAAIGVGGDARLLGVSASGAAEAMTGLFKAGLTSTQVFGDLNAYMSEGAELGGALRASIDLAAATELDMVQASELAATALSTFGSELETDAERAQFVEEALNNFNQAANASVADVSDMAAALTMVGPAASGANFGIEEVNNALAVLSGAGIRGSMAGTSLNSMINSLRDTTPKATEALDELGIAVRDASTGEMLPMVGIIEQFEQKLGDATAAERDAALGAIFTSQGLRAMDTLLGKGVEGWEEMADATADAATIQEQAAKKADTFAGAMEGFGGIIETIQIQIGDALLPVANRLLSWVSEMVERHGPALTAFFEEVGGVVDNFVAILLTTADEGGVLLDYLQELPAWLQPIAEVIGGLIILFQDFRAGVVGVDYPWEDVFPPAIADAIYAIVGGVQVLLETVGPFIEQIWTWVSQNVELQDVLLGLAGVIGVALVPIIGTLVGAIASFVGPILLAIAIAAALRQAWETNFLGVRDVVMNVIGWLQEFIPQAIATVRQWWEENGAAILANAQMVWQTVRTAIVTAVQTAWAIIQTVVLAIRTFWQENGAAILANAQMVWQTIVAAISGAINTVAGIVQSVAGALASFWQAHGDTLTTVAKTAWDTIKTFIQTAITVITSVIQAFMAAIRGDWTAFGAHLRTAANAVWDNIINIFQNAATIIGEVVSELVQAIVDWFKGKDWGSVGKNVVQGIANGITAGASLIANAAKAAARAAWEAAKGFFGIGSPSKLFQVVGHDVGEGLALGILESIGTVEGAVTQMLSAAAGLGQIGSTFGGFYEESVLDPLSDNLDETDDQIEETEGNIEKLKEAFKEISRELYAPAPTGLTPQEETERLVRLGREYSRVSRELSTQQGRRNELLGRRNQLASDFAQLSERINRLEESRSRLRFLQEQVKLLDLITEHGLDVEEVLGGMQLGLEASTEELIDATTRAMQGIVQAANDELGLRSPSRVFQEKGQQISQGLMLGLFEGLDTAAIQQQMRTLVPEISPIPAVTSYNVTKHLAPNYNLTTQSMVRPGGLRMEFEAMEAAGAIAA